MARGRTKYDEAQAGGQRLLTPVLHMGFALTGIGTVLLGTILPRISSQWHLRDKDAGLVLLVQFSASASGALLTRGHLWRTLAGGYALCACAAIAIFLLQQSTFSLFLMAFGLFGLGLGLAMTSTNMLVSRLCSPRRGAALALLNFFWSAGAVACPLAVGWFFPKTSAGTLFGLAGLLLLPFAPLTVLVSGAAWQNTRTLKEPTSTGLPEARIIVYFALLAFLYVGIEATVGNWISTYATRASAWSMTGSSLAVATFWAALVLGRGLTPLSLKLVAELTLYQASSVMAIGGIVLLLSARDMTFILLSAAITGFALAPLFPLTISLFLAETGESRNAGWVFALAGLGGAALSWLTGFVSTSTGSLRMGLLVPSAAALLMVVLIAWPRPQRTLIRPPFA